MRLGTAGGRVRLRAAPNAEQHLRARLRLAQLYPARVAGRNAEDRRALPVFAGRAALRVPGRDRAARRDRDQLSARS